MGGVKCTEVTVVFLSQALFLNQDNWNYLPPISIGNLNVTLGQKHLGLLPAWKKTQQVECWLLTKSTTELLQAILLMNRVPNPSQLKNRKIKKHYSASFY